MMPPLRSLPWVLFSSTLSILLVVAACGSERALKGPVSDNNFDDPDQPPAPGVVTIPVGKREAGTGCKLDRECASSLRCYFRIADGCSAVGRCLSYKAPPGCVRLTRCACDGRLVDECTPDADSPAPLSASSTCDASAE